MSQVAADALVEEGNGLLQTERFVDAARSFERAAQLFPQHPLAWKGLGLALLSMGQPHDAARALDKAVGFRPNSATALWAGAVAHAEIGNKVVAQNYLHRALSLQPSWVDMARTTPALAAFLRMSTFVSDLIRSALGPYSGRTYRHASDDGRAVEVGRIVNTPRYGTWTFVTIGLSNRAWPEPNRPRVELVMQTMLDTELCGQVLANLAFHLGDTGFFPDPGTMVRDVVGALDAGDLSRRLPHVYISYPRGWNTELPLSAGPPPTTLAQVVPVSEREYAEWRNDVRAFDQRISRIDVSDLRRE